MKLHLPLNLYKALLLAAVAGTVTFTQDAYAGGMHSDVHLQTYTDFGQNKGRYVVGAQENALLKHIRQQDGGIKITYTDNTTPFVISNEQGMIDFRGTYDIGADVAVSPTFVATVLHNGSNDASYGNRTVGDAHAINYESIDIRNSDVFRLFPTGHGNDYMLQRQSKLQTDAVWNPVTNVTEMSTLVGDYLYHSGAGGMQMFDSTYKKYRGLTGAYVYIVGGIGKIRDSVTHAGTTNISICHDPYYTAGGGAGTDFPLPNAIRGGDSGSPTFIYNETTKQYEYIAAMQSGINSFSQARGNVVWTHDTLNSFNKQVDFSKGTIDGDSSTVYLNAIGENQAGEVKKDKLGNTGTIYTGKVTNGAGEELATYRGIRNGLNTWSDLSDIKNNEKWYAYTGHLVQKDTDLFFNDNIIFTADSAAEINNVVLNADVDLGVGYVEFKEGKYNISAAGDYQLDSAGYVLNAGAEVHLKLTNTSERMTEWRAMGEGTLYIDGKGDTNALLNLGGKSTTYLNQSDGYAAYNVLVNTGATVVISDINQIERDFTFGSGGGTLDLNGNSHTWDNSDAVEDAGFTIHALTDEALITNSSTNKVTITVTSPDSVYKGSFTGNMDVVYTGSGNWTLHSIHTKLADGCGFTVQSGKVIFSGVNTEHGMGSATGTNKNRLVNTRDWHYADAQMNVTVNGGTFELGSHARLTGAVTVKNGTFIMREGVQHDREYVEGGVSLEAVSDYKDYYGLKGKVSLSDGTSLQIHYNAGVTAHNEYAYDITGSGNVSVNLGTDGAKLTLSGNNTFSGSKTLTSGTLIAGTHDALGDCETNKWKIEDAGVLSMTGVTQDSTQVWQSYVASDSTGVLALSENQTTQLALSEHQNLIIGALEGKTVTYGNSSETLTAHNGGWVLGGGGGTLVVESLLTDGEDAAGKVVKHNLVLGNQYGTGTVKLNNLENDFSGTITVNGKMTLDYAVANGKSALGNATLDVNYGNRVYGRGSTDNFSGESSGTMLIVSDRSDKINLENHQNLFIGSDVSNGVYLKSELQLAEGAAYRFGGSKGYLVVQSELSSGHDLIIDGQGYSDGIIQLDSTSNFDGNVTIMGYDETQTQSTTGDVAVVLASENALANANEINIKNGGQLLWSYSYQNFGKINVGATGVMFFSGLPGYGGCSIKSGTIAGSVVFGIVDKISDGTLDLTGAGLIATLNVKEGVVNLTGDSTLETVNIVTESSQSGSTATIGGDAYVVTVNLNNNGSLTVGGSASIASLQLNAGGALTLEGNKFTISDLVINAGASYNVKSADRADGIGDCVTMVTLAGGTLANIGADAGDNLCQFFHVKLTADSTVDSRNSFGIIGRGYDTTKLDLGGKTLTKTGSGDFDIYNTSVTEGTVNVEEGQLHFNDKDKAHHSVIAADIALTGEGASFNIDKTGTGVVALAGDSTEVSSMNIRKGSVVLAGAQASVDSVSVNGGKLLLGSYTSAVDDRDVTTVTFNKGVVIEGKDGKEGTITGGITTTTADGGLTISLSGASSTDKAIVANTLIDIMEGCTLEMSNVVLQDTSRVTDATATFKVNDVVAQVSGNNIATRESTTMGTTTLTAFGAERTTIEVDAAAHVLNLTSSLMDTVSVTGSNFIIELDEDINLEGYSYVSLTFTDGYTPASFDAGMDITLVYGDSTYEVYYAGDDTTKLYAAIPEPTTASLSLLALAALAARRRRK